MVSGMFLAAVILTTIDCSSGMPNLDTRGLENEPVFDAILYAYTVDSSEPSFLGKGDQIFALPSINDYVSISQNPQMSMNFVYSDSEHTAASKVATSMSVGGSFGAFSAAASMEVSSSASSSIKTVRMDSLITALKYQVSSKNDFRNFPEKFLTDSFKAAVKAFPVEKIEQNIGVFYATSMDLGGEIRKSYIMQATEDDTEESVKSELEAEYGSSLMGASVKASAGVSYETRKSNKESNMKIEWSCQGGNVLLWLGRSFSDSGDDSVNAIQKAWAASVDDSNLYAFNYELGYMWDLVGAVDKQKGEDFKEYLQKKWIANRNAFVPSKFLPRSPVQAPTGCVDDSIGYSNTAWGTVIQQFCADNEVVVSLHWMAKSNYGLVDLNMTCSDGNSYRFSWDSAAGFLSDKDCSSRYNYGIRGIQGREQSNYGMINAAMECTGGEWTRAGVNLNGWWNTATVCSEGSVITGMTVIHSWRWGVVNWRPRCSQLLIKNNWRDDLRCGASYPLPDGSPARCNPRDPDGNVCCSPAGWCGSTPDHCTCSGCTNWKTCTTS